MTHSAEVKNIDQLVELAHDNNFDRRQRSIIEVINEAIDNFESAIKSLELSDAANADLERSMLDAAVHTALMMLELALYKRLVEGRDMPITKREAHDIEHSRWGKFVQSKSVLKYLGKIDDLEDL